MKKRYFFILFITMFLLTTSVKAASTSVVLDNRVSVPVSENELNILPNSAKGSWASWGSGTLVFSFSVTGYVTERAGGVDRNYLRLPKGVHIFTGSQDVACDLGDNLGYYDNTSTSAIFSVTCNVSSGFSSAGLQSIQVEFVHPLGSGYVGISSSETLETSSFLTYYTNVNYDDIVSAVNSTTSAINSQMSSFTQKQQETTDAINNNGTTINNSINSASSQAHSDAQAINDSITDSSIDTSTSDSSTSGFNDTTNSGMSNTPVSNLITLPITFLTGVNSAISGSCTNVNYIELFGYQLVLPCLNLSERLGNVWVIIDTICSCMLIFSIGKSLVGTFARLSDMDTNIMYECYANGVKHRGESFND